MRVDITRQNFGSTLILFAILGGIIWHRWNFAPIRVEGTQDLLMPVGAALNALAGMLPGWAANLGALLITLLSGILITRLIARNMILLERTYMPVVIYLVVGCGSWYDPLMWDAFTASLLLILSFDRMIDSFRRQVIYSHTFNASLLLGLAVLVYAPAAIYALLFPVMMILLRKSWREWLVSLCGIVLPLLLCSYVSWCAGDTFAAPLLRLGEALLQAATLPAFLSGWLNPLLWLLWIILVALTLWSLGIFLREAASMRTRPYKSYLFFIWILLISILPLLAAGRSPKEMLFLAAPLAVIVPTCFNRRESTLRNLLYLLLLICMVLYQLIPLPELPFTAR